MRSEERRKERTTPHISSEKDFLAGEEEGKISPRKGAAKMFMQ